MATALAVVASETEAAARKRNQASRGWQIDVGIVSIDSSGVALRPQMLFGVRIENFLAEAGLHDLRDGLKVSAQAEAAMSVLATGMSLQELHDTIAIDTFGFREALDAAKGSFGSSAGQLDTCLPGDLAKSIGISQDLVESIFIGKHTKRCTPMTLKVTAEVGIGFSTTVCLGWKDSQGYSMFGVGGGASAILSMKHCAFAGSHQKNRSAKVLLGIHNFKFEYTFPTGSLEGRCPACDGSGFVEGSGFLGWGESECPKCRGGGELACSSHVEQSVSDGLVGALGVLLPAFLTRGLVSVLCIREVKARRGALHAGKGREDATSAFLF